MGDGGAGRPRAGSVPERENAGVVRPRPSMLPVYAACFAIAAAFVGAVVIAGYLLR
ncbi:MAG: hypothetical protein AMXMBFR46_05850 [Acidimicrobiia bacterium]